MNERLLRSIANELTTLRKQIHAILQERQADKPKADNKPVQPFQLEIPTAPDLPKAAYTYYESENNDRNSTWQKIKPWVETSGVIVAVAIAGLSLWTTLEIHWQRPSIEKSADAAKSAAEIASKALIVGNRPWVKVVHEIVQPLTFNDHVGPMGATAVMKVKDTFENVGQTIALNVLAWEDVIPEDYETPPGANFTMPTDRSAIARQHDWCDTNRNSEQSRRIGNILFPHSPTTQISGIGPTMSTVTQSMVGGKVSFVMVGCVCYRSSFEDPKTPNHQTRFIYRLGIPQPWGGWYPFVLPTGTASTLRLIASFNTFSAD
jgi:hypothetical protein